MRAQSSHGGDLKLKCYVFTCNFSVALTLHQSASAFSVAKYFILEAGSESQNFKSGSISFKFKFFDTLIRDET